MKTMPELTEEERRFVRERVAGTDVAEAYRRAHGAACEKLSPQALGGKAVQLDRLPRIRTWFEFLSAASPKEVIEQVYQTNLAYGNTDESMKAAKAYLDSQFAGAEVAELFLRTLEECGAEIVLHAEDGTVYRGKVRAKGSQLAATNGG